MKWAPVKGFEDRYEVSDAGIVRSIHRPNFAGKQGGHTLKQWSNSSGYMVVNLWRAGKQTKEAVHRIVLAAFHSEPKKNHECRHLNGNKTDNRLENLNWGTHSENMLDRTDHGSFGRLSSDDITRMFELRSCGNTLREISELVGCSVGHVSRVLRGVQRKNRR